MKKLLLTFLATLPLCLSAQQAPNAFKQLYEELPTPNIYRTASGAPGHAYWQQRADHLIKVTLDDENQTISGTQTITYFNHSPDNLPYLWLQLDQNRRAPDSDSDLIRSGQMRTQMSERQLQRMENDFPGGFHVSNVRHGDGQPLPYTIHKTMMRIDLPEPLRSGDHVSFSMDWWYQINDRMKIGGRSGYEFFPDDGNYLYTIAQFFPRMAVYSDNEGWQNKQFLGRGEFTLTFGNYSVAITVPDDHLVAATGTLQNPDEVLSKSQKRRLDQAYHAFDTPVIIATEDEAIEREKRRSTKTKTWKFEAEMVRDFAFASSRKMIWDAMAVKQKKDTVMAMSMYPKEGNPLWERYSTKVIAHTLKWYSHYTFDYPYPVAWSIHADRIGMEYPMICFNGGRPEPDGTYSERTKYGMISVIIHEVGHNYFPMIVNSDERQWTWMDEGLNSFVQFLTEQQWERDYPSRRGPAFKIVDYMKTDPDYLSPVMLNSESLFQFGNNAYAKPATALNILRETIMGRELFDFAFREYAHRWKFKHPSPADFFRTMEDASAVDLDWFWRGWFFTTDHVDLSISSVQWYRMDNEVADTVMSYEEQFLLEQPMGISSMRNRNTIQNTQDEIDSLLRDFYTNYRIEQREKQSNPEANTPRDGKNYYEITFENHGGLVMPVILEFTFADGTKEVRRIPAEIWRQNNHRISKVFALDKPLRKINLDPFLETADVNRRNNYFPPEQELNRFERFQNRRQQRSNPMQRARKKEKGT